MGQAETGGHGVQQALEAKATQKSVFVEDMTPEERAQYYKHVLKEVLKVGLVNLGNTCYLNSTLQLLNRINEFKDVLASKPASNAPQNAKLAAALRDVLAKLENSGEAFEPSLFLAVFFGAFPQFAEKDEHGHGFQQQDADECIQLLLSALEPLFDEKGHNRLRELFELRFRVQFFNKETNEVEGDEAFETAHKLTCIIDNQMNPVNALQDGVRLALEDQISKHSEKLGRNADFAKRFRLQNLPGYLLIQKIRFVWREKDAATNTEARKAKILRNVSFPRVLDIFEFCDEGLQKELTANRREEVEDAEELKKEASVAYENFKKEQGAVEEDNYKIYRRFKDEQKKKEDAAHAERLWAPIGSGLPTANYELVGVVTHKGRSSDSGHYVSWIQQKGDAWLKFDDDVVTPVNIDDVLNLRGGGDWHMAYYLLYRRLDFFRRSHPKS